MQSLRFLNINGPDFDKIATVSECLLSALLCFRSSKSSSNAALAGLESCPLTVLAAKSEGYTSAPHYQKPGFETMLLPSM